MLLVDTTYTQRINMQFEKFEYIDNNIRLVIEEDLVGYYLYVYRNPKVEAADQDYLLDDLEMAKDEAYERFGIDKQKWKKI